jgi:hypothetical protein
MQNSIYCLLKCQSFVFRQLPKLPFQMPELRFQLIK